MLRTLMMFSPYSGKNASGKGDVDIVKNVKSYLGLFWKCLIVFNIISISPARSMFWF